jgi:secreted PhoX family phosphatase
MSFSRRVFLGASAASLAFSGVARAEEDDALYINEVEGYGRLKEDPFGVFDLPEGFTYKVVSQAGDAMSDGLVTPYKFDGMGCFGLDKDRVILVRNHELKPKDVNHGPAGVQGRFAGKLDASRAYALDPEGRVLPGGTTTLVYNIRKNRLEREHQSLAGTSINCAGGITTCEETTARAGQGSGKDHGWIFEVPSRAKGLVDPAPLKAMGRFKREAACVDPRTGVVYMTEDTTDSLLYRFLPDTPGQLALGGKLQALGFVDAPAGCDTRNWTGAIGMIQGDWRDARWIDLDNPESPDDDLRLRGAKAGAAVFARGEGIFWGKDELYFTCTSGGAAGAGQIMRYVPSAREGQADEANAPGKAQLFLESKDARVLDYADNIAISPWGHIIVCEDRYSDTKRNHLKGITPEGKVYTLARNVFRENAELAGVCFSPDGSTLFVNIYWPGITLAVTGPWATFRG